MTHTASGRANMFHVKRKGHAMKQAKGIRQQGTGDVLLRDILQYKPDSSDRHADFLMFIKTIARDYEQWANVRRYARPMTKTTAF